MKLILQVLVILLSIPNFAQIGINTTDPKSLLQIVASDPAAPNNSDGLLIPSLDNFPATNPTTDQNGMLVFLRTATGPSSAFGTNPIGFYYWNNPLTTWIGLNTTKSNWLLSGNSSTIDGTNYIGTKDNVPLNFKINSEKAGRLSTSQTFFGYLSGNVNTGINNTGIGDGSLRDNTSGEENTAVGSEAMFFNTIGRENTAVGRRALRDNTEGNENTALGREALYSNTTGTENTAIGRHAIHQNTTGFNNTAVGKNALENNTTAKENTAIGKDALRDNKTGEKNTAIGTESLIQNRDGNENIGVGFASLWENNSGNQNVGIGYNALRNTKNSFNTGIGHNAMNSNITGEYNTAIGYNALSQFGTGTNNTAIGHNSDVSATGLTNATAIGYNAIADASNMIRLGNSFVSSIKAQVAITVSSDRRFKENIKDIPLGLHFINSLRPVEYFRKNNTTNKKEWGLIAQELQTTIDKFSYENAGIVSEDNTENHYLSVRYTDLIAPIIKAIQELSENEKEIETLKNKFEEQDRQIKNLLKRIEELEK